MQDPELLSILYQAAASPAGVSVRTSDPNLLIHRAYKLIRKNAILVGIRIKRPADKPDTLLFYKEPIV